MWIAEESKSPLMWVGRERQLSRLMPTQDTVVDGEGEGSLLGYEGLPFPIDLVPRGPDFRATQAY